MNISNGLDFILSHFEVQFPRTISTLQTQGKQVLIHSKDEVLEFFKESNYVDCRISAFGKLELELEQPNLIFVDLDNREAKNETLALFHKTINGIPTVIHTGNGLAIIQPIDMKPWINQTYNGKTSEELTKLFLSWSERYLTNSKCDVGNHPSLKSCLIRVPGSFNSKLINQGYYEMAQVKILCEWNKQRVHVKNLPFRNYLDKLVRKENNYRKKWSNSPKGEIKYIEKILHQEPITNGRQRFFAMILCPYLINVKNLSLEESQIEIIRYFGDYIPKSLIRYKLNEVSKKGILPYSLNKMQENDPELYNIVTKQQVTTK